MNKPHPHADLVHAWADGAEIELMCMDGEWIDDPMPVFHYHMKYRIKPAKREARRWWVGIFNDGSTQLWLREYKPASTNKLIECIPVREVLPDEQ